MPRYWNFIWRYHFLWRRIGSRIWTSRREFINLGEDTLNDTEVTLDNFNETLEDKLNALDQFDNILGNNENDSEFLDGKDKFDLEEMDQFGNDIELCRHIVTSIEKIL